MKKYTAVITEIDRDYSCFSGEERIQVDSEEEAKKWCKDNKWTGHMYILDFLIENCTESTNEA